MPATRINIAVNYTITMKVGFPSISDVGHDGFRANGNSGAISYAATDECYSKLN